MNEPVLVDDAARDATVERLSEALAVGRLTVDEFEGRVGAALRARTDEDIAVVLRGLPSPPPSAASEGFASGRSWIRQPGALVGAACVTIGVGLLAFVGIAVGAADQEQSPIVVCQPAPSVDEPDC